MNKLIGSNQGKMKKSNHAPGFTLIEVLVAMAVSTVVIGAVYSAFCSQQKANKRERLIVDMNQNVRAALYLIKKEIKQAGFDPTVTWGIDRYDNDHDLKVDEADENENNRNLDGFDNDSCYDRGAGPDTFRLSRQTMDERFGIQIAGPHLLRFNMDLNGDRDVCDGNEEISFGFAKKNDTNQDGVADLRVGGSAPIGRSTGRGYLQPLSGNIQVLAFAYAFDFDQGVPMNERDGVLDMSSNQTIIWAFDSDGDGFLDKFLDTNEDGHIDTKDIPGGDNLDVRIPLACIRAVRIWLLARTDHPVSKINQSQSFVVGRHHLRFDDRYVRLLLESVVQCQNL